jgi:large subunit ribosomal protein L21
MFAVIRTGGKQYRVSPNDIIQIERIAGEPGDIIELGDVLLLGGGDGAPKAGSPAIAGALVAAEVVEQFRGEKIVVFKKKRRKNYRRKNGHRQELTLLRITEILTDGNKPSQTKAAQAESKKAEKVEKKPAEPKAAKPARPATKAETKAAPKAKATAKPAAAKDKAPKTPKPKKS